MTHNLFFTIDGAVALVLLFLSMARQWSWKFENAGVTILQYGLAAECVYLFHLGLLWEVIR